MQRLSRLIGDDDVPVLDTGGENAETVEPGSERASAG
jgi:hypothetical protein